MNKIKKVEFLNEKEMVDLIVRKFSSIFPSCEFIEKEFELKDMQGHTRFRIDILGYNKSNNTIQIIECKNKEDKEEFIKFYNSKFIDMKTLLNFIIPILHRI